MALVAVFLLAFQASPGTPWRGAAGFDAFSVLCTHDGGRPPEAPAPHHDDGGCCLAGCAMGVALPPPLVAAVPMPRRTAMVDRPRPEPAGDEDRAPRASPLTIRGPPASA